MAPPVAIAADTPQIEMPEASAVGPADVRHQAVEVDDRPEDEISADDGTGALKQHGARQRSLVESRDAQKPAKQHDGRLDIQLGTDRFLHHRRNSWHEVADHQSGEQGNDKTRLVGQVQGPANLEGRPAIGCGGNVSPTARKPAGIAQGEDRGKSFGKFFQVRAQTFCTDQQNHQHEDVSCYQGNKSRQVGVSLGGRAEGFRGIDPYRGVNSPAQQVDAE